MPRLRVIRRVEGCELLLLFVYSQFFVFSLALSQCCSFKLLLAMLSFSQ